MRKRLYSFFIMPLLALVLSISVPASANTLTGATTYQPQITTLTGDYQMPMDVVTANRPMSTLLGAKALLMPQLGSIDYVANLSAGFMTMVVYGNDRHGSLSNTLDLATSNCRSCHLDDTFFPPDT